MTAPKKQDDELAGEAKDSTVYWFLALDIAHEQNDFAAAARAQRELRRLGVDVRYLPACRTGRADK